MSFLIVHECRNEVFQAISPTENILTNTIRPHLYIHNSPAGSIKVQIRDENGYLISESSGVTITSLKTNSFAHGYYSFELKTPLKKDTIYQVAVVCYNGYSFLDSAYVGVCKDWDRPIKTVQGYPAPNLDYSSPLDIEIWGRDKKMRTLDFSDSFENATEPSQGIITTTGLQQFVDDAAFELQKGGPGDEGDIYFNTTLKVPRNHNGTRWENVDYIFSPKQEFVVANNISVAADVTGLEIDGADYSSAVVEWEIQRSDATPTNLSARGRSYLLYENSIWTIESEFTGDAHGVTLTVDQTGSVAQVQYTSTNMTGGSYAGIMKFETRAFD